MLSIINKTKADKAKDKSLPRFTWEPQSVTSQAGTVADLTDHVSNARNSCAAKREIAEDTFASMAPT